LNQRLSALFGAQPRFSEAEFDLLFLEHYSRIAIAAYQLLGDYDEAEDLAAEAFWKLWRHPPAHGENVPGWLYRVVINLGYNRLRSTRRRAGHENHAYLLDVERLPAPGPEDEVSRREEEARTRTVLSTMAEKDVQLLMMHAAGFSYKEIAAAMKISLGSVGVLITRAEHKFERLFVQGEKHAPQS
jgi:RNA polymerase sigma factor (sigma-70 family)